VRHGEVGHILAGLRRLNRRELQENEPGWAAGVGVEAALTDNITARAEYLYVDLEHASLTGATAVAPVTVNFSANLIRLGLDYKFR